MKPNNISDVEKEFEEEFFDFIKFIKKDTSSKNATDQIKEFYRHQIEQLLGRIDTEKRGRNSFDTYYRLFGYNQKSSEIANQIKDLMK
jgi:hypothetical protein